MKYDVILYGFLVHVIFFYSIFDIYFTSPISHGMTPHRSRLKFTPADRLVLFVMDGLRADKLMRPKSNGEYLSPFLRDVVENKGAWGISHTRVPTESRPGHVALIAGLYEDVSAIAKGWKENPVEFDSVFNSSRETWSWGSPDVVPMFSQNLRHVHSSCYSSSEENFAASDSSKVDVWVFNKVEKFLEDSKHNVTLRKRLHKNKIVFFLHLLGIDINGHAHKPFSQQYLSNIETTSQGIERMHRVFQEFFRDNRTAYIVTSDHGMTDWGSHGAGDWSETLTPLIAWGSGVRKPITAINTYKDTYENDWNLSHLKRTDVNQADIAALMATLLGVDFPVNSEGVLPLDFMDQNEEQKAHAIFANARQILANLQVKMREKKESSFKLLFYPFKGLIESEQRNQIRVAHKLMVNKKFKELIIHCKDLIDLSLKGIRYYHTYDRFFLEFSISASFILWMMYVSSLILAHTPISCREKELSLNNSTKICFVVISTLVALFILVQNLNWRVYIYCLLPVLLLHKVLCRSSYLISLLNYIYKEQMICLALFTTLMSVVALEIIIMSFFYRYLLTIGLILLSFLPLLATSNNISSALNWMVASIFLSVFPMLPVVGQESNFSYVYYAGVLAAILSTAIYLGSNKLNLLKKNYKSYLLTFFQISLIVCSVIVQYIIRSEIQLSPFMTQIIHIYSWIVLVLSFVIPLSITTHLYSRLFTITLCFLPSYILLSTAHEVFFYIVLSLTLLCWLHSHENTSKIERKYFTDGINITKDHRLLVPIDIICAYIFLFLLITAFFGTGNVASVNSFQPSSILCFVSVFQPFLMAGLLIWKVIIPFLLVTCYFKAVHACISVPLQALFLLVLLMSDFMALHFFYLVKDTGSWLDIGTSISHYVIVMLTILVTYLFIVLSSLLTSVQLFLRRGMYDPLVSLKPHTT